MHSGSALAISLPRDCAKEGVVRSRTLGACNLSLCLLRYRTRQIVPPLVCVCGGGGGGVVLSVGCERLHCFFASPSEEAGDLCSCLRWKALFRPVVFTCTLCVALVDSLASRVGSSLAPQFLCPGPPQGPVLCSSGGLASRNEGLSRAR